jgi:hypothetical protein
MIDSTPYYFFTDPSFLSSQQLIPQYEEEGKDDLQQASL